MRLPVVEDEPRLAAGLRKGLEAEGFAVDVVYNGPDGGGMSIGQTSTQTTVPTTLLEPIVRPTLKAVRPKGF
jgi:DNA-binding response OmpR family regulator